MISLIVLRGLPVRRANSACVIPIASRVSARVSPGGDTSSGVYSFLTMPWLPSVVIDDFDDDDGRDFRPVQSAVVATRPRVSRFEDESARVVGIDGQLSHPFPFELMAPRRW